jgi:hypothetical protein
VLMQVVQPGRVLYTYDVEWKASTVKWASRWDIYLNMDHRKSDKVRAPASMAESGAVMMLLDSPASADQTCSKLLIVHHTYLVRQTSSVHHRQRHGCWQVHWFSIANSMLIVLFLTGMIAMILIRNLCRDITRYNRVPTEEERAEER